MSFCQNLLHFTLGPSEANRDGVDAKSPFPLFLSFSASFKNSSPREEVGKLSSFWDWWVESLFVSILSIKWSISIILLGTKWMI